MPLMNGKEIATPCYLKAVTFKDVKPGQTFWLNDNYEIGAMVRLAIPMQVHKNTITYNPDTTWHAVSLKSGHPWMAEDKTGNCEEYVVLVLED